ncbi:hypothetical protein D3C73_869950 [compost metagenome]
MKLFLGLTVEGELWAKIQNNERKESIVFVRLREDVGTYQRMQNYPCLSCFYDVQR